MLKMHRFEVFLTKIGRDVKLAKMPRFGAFLTKIGTDVKLAENVSFYLKTLGNTSASNWNLIFIFLSFPGNVVLLTIRKRPCTR